MLKSKLTTHILFLFLFFVAGPVSIAQNGLNQKKYENDLHKFSFSYPQQYILEKINDDEWLIHNTDNSWGVGFAVIDRKGEEYESYIKTKAEQLFNSFANKMKLERTFSSLVKRSETKTSLVPGFALDIISYTLGGAGQDFRKAENMLTLYLNVLKKVSDNAFVKDGIIMYDFRKFSEGDNLNLSKQLFDMFEKTLQFRKIENKKPVTAPVKPKLPNTSKPTVQKIQPVTATSALEKFYQLHLNAMGGEAKLNALKSYSYNSANANNQISVISYKSPGLFNSSYTFDKGTNSVVIKGTESWQSSFDKTVTKGPGISFTIYDIMRYSLHGFLFDARRLKFKLTLLSTAETEAKIKNYKSFYRFDIKNESILIKVTPAVASEYKSIYTVVLDAETYLIQLIVEDNEYSMKNIAFSDYKTIDGLQVFSKVAFGSEGKLNLINTLSNFQLNGIVKPELFVTPVVTAKPK
ncbi:MAG: hypothetical protein ABIP79_00345 [Chitinophagaceae bacterium]